LGRWIMRKRALAHSPMLCKAILRDKRFGGEPGGIVNSADYSREHVGDAKFFRALITVMALALVAGFVLQLSAGRSSFTAPFVVHAHAVVFMGWVGITLAQVWLVSGGNVSLHITLGRMAAVYTMLLVVLGVLVTIAAVQTGRTPFFFQPQHFMLADIATLIAFLGLFVAALVLRKHSDWHARLHVGAFMGLMGPGVGRLLSMPLLMPYAFEIAAGIPLVFAVIGAARDLFVRRSIHPAWLCSIAAIVAALALARVTAFSPLGDSLYAIARGNSEQAGPDGRAFPPPPFGPPPSG